MQGSKLETKTPKYFSKWYLECVFIVNFEYIQHKYISILGEIKVDKRAKVFLQHGTV